MGFQILHSPCYCPRPLVLSSYGFIIFDKLRDTFWFFLKDVAQNALECMGTIATKMTACWEVVLVFGAVKVDWVTQAMVQSDVSIFLFHQQDHCLSQVQISPY